jgi:hypothetical protein
MKNNTAVLLLAVLVVAGCDSAQRTVDTLQKEIATYPSAPSAEAAEKIEQSFDRLDQKIGRLRSAGKIQEAESLDQQRQNLQAQYLAARMTEGLQKMKQAAEGLGAAFREAGEAFGTAIKSQPPPSPEQ